MKSQINYIFYQMTVVNHNVQIYIFVQQLKLK